jgi:Ca2+-binding RTX toxin-like protein
MPTITLTPNNDNWSTTAAGAYTVYGLEGNDTLRILTSRFASGDAGDTLYGGDGNDLLSAAGTNDQLYGDAGDDTLVGGNGDDLLDGGDGKDILDAGSGNDTLYGGAGDDTLLGGFGDDKLYGGDGNDLITDTAGNNTVDGGAGDDQIITSSGNDNVLGGDGNDEITLGAGDDIANGGTGADRMFGGSGNDVMDAGGGLGNDYIDGGDGVDIATYVSATAGVTVALGLVNPDNTPMAQDTIGAGVDTLAAIENLTGSNFDDTLTGDALNNLLNGGAGNDRLDGGDGNDGLVGGSGNDTLMGGPGADQNDGGTGVDTVDYSSSPAAVVINLSDALNESGGFAEGDVLNFDTDNNGSRETRTVEVIKGSAFDDTLTGDDLGIQFEGQGGNDTITGGAGVDALFGGDGNDIISGLAGNDGIDGGAGDDNIAGGTGVDTLLGRAGNDSLAGGDGNDTLQGGDGGDLLDGGAGSDIAFYSDSTSAVTINLADGLPESGGFAAGDVLSGIENILGSSFNDTLIGDGGVNQIFGNSGDDIITGGAGRDVLFATTSTGQTTGVDTFDYNALSELESASGSTLGAWDTIFGFTGGTGTGRDLIDVHDLMVSLGLSFANSAAAFSSGNLGLVGVTLGGVSSSALFVDTNGGVGFGDGGEFWVAGLSGVSAALGNGLSTANVIV